MEEKLEETKLRREKYDKRRNSSRSIDQGHAHMLLQREKERQTTVDEEEEEDDDDDDDDDTAQMDT